MKYVVGIYVALIFVFWIYLSNWGVNAHMSKAYNLGGALFWPVIIFPSLGKAVGGVIILGLVAFSVFFVKNK